MYKRIGMNSMSSWKNKNLIIKTSYSLNGFRMALKAERSVRLEILAALVFPAIAAYRGLPTQTILSVFLLCLAPIMVELINTAVESIIDLLLGAIFREDVKRAKDMLSASVLLSLCISYGFALKMIFL